MQKAGTIKYILIDAEDSEKLAEFWSKVLGRPIKKQFGPYTELGSNDVPKVSIQKVDKHTPEKNNIHFDLQTNDLDASQSYIESLGGKLVEVQRKGKWEWRIMADPEGNVFCLVVN
jgi:predicted enzyme related to lactoylglutathione lyase